MIVIVVLVGCAAQPEPMAAPVEVEGVILVQTIPRGAYVERDEEYVGVAPIEVPVRVWRDSGRLVRSVKLRAVDVSTGAWVQRVVTPYAPTPERVMLDMRAWMEPRPALSWR